MIKHLNKIKGDKVIYNLYYYLMLIGYLGLVFYANNLKNKIIGILLLIVNALIFKR